MMTPPQGEALRMFRARWKLNQTQLGKLLSVSRQTIYRYEKEKRSLYNFQLGALELLDEGLSKLPYNQARTALLAALNYSQPAKQEWIVSMFPKSSPISWEEYFAGKEESHASETNHK